MIVNGTVEERGSQAKIRASGSHQHKPHTSNSFLITQIVPITQNPGVTPTPCRSRQADIPSTAKARQSSGLHPATEKPAPPAAAKIPLGNTRFSGTSGNPGLSGNPGTSSKPQTIRQSSFLKYQEPPTFLPAPDSHATPSAHRGSAPTAHP